MVEIFILNKGLTKNKWVFILYSKASIWLDDEKYIKNKCNTVRIINEVLPEFRQYISGKFAEW